MTVIWALAVLLFQGGGGCPSLLREAEKAFEARQLEAAIAGFERAVAACPPRADLHIPLAQLLFLQGRRPEAERALKTALEIDPRHTGALYALGRIYYEQRRYPEAIARFEQVVGLDPQHYKAWDNLGVCHDSLHNDTAALKSFFRALDLVMKDHPEYDWAHANLGDFFLRREQYEKAFQLAAEAARRNPESARNAFIAGKALAKLEKHELSLRWLEQAVKLDAVNKEAWYVLAQEYRKLGRAEEAARALEKFRELTAAAAPAK